MSQRGEGLGCSAGVAGKGQAEWCEEGKWADVTNEWSGLGLQSEDEPQGRQVKGMHMQHQTSQRRHVEGQPKARASWSARLPVRYLG